ncbi:MAG: hypothetical protein WCT31_03795 [Candidatus Micrarchaeia archaeon]|jgi:hypothetical protein
MQESVRIVTPLSNQPPKNGGCLRTRLSVHLKHLGLTETFIFGGQGSTAEVHVGELVRHKKTLAVAVKNWLPDSTPIKSEVALRVHHNYVALSLLKRLGLLPHLFVPTLYISCIELTEFHGSSVFNLPVNRLPSQHHLSERPTPENGRKFVDLLPGSVNNQLLVLHDLSFGGKYALIDQKHGLTDADLAGVREDILNVCSFIESSRSVVEQQSAHPLIHRDRVVEGLFGLFEIPPMSTKFPSEFERSDFKTPPAMIAIGDIDGVPYIGIDSLPKFTVLVKPPELALPPPSSSSASC